MLLCQLLILAVFLGLWEYATAWNKQAAFLFGSPSAIGGFLVKMWQDGSLVRDTWVTGLETILGFLAGNILGTVLGLSLWYSRFVSRVVQPFIVALGSIPIIALAPIVIIWFGTGLASKIAMSTLSVVIVALVTSYKGAMSVDPDQIFIVALGSIPIIALAPIVIIWFGTGLASKIAMSTLSVVIVALVTSYKGAMSVDPDQINLMRTLGASKRHIFQKLVVPASLTDIFAGLKLTVGFALIGAIVGEFMSSSEGLGHAIFKAGSLYIIPKVFAALVATIALALVLAWAVGKLEQLLTPWRREA